MENNSKLIEHNRLHENVEKFQCVYCKKNVGMKSLLAIHVKTHIDSKKNPKDFQCEYCGRIFKTKWHLSSHLVSHSDEYSFTCDVCGNKFRTKEYLRRHLVRHVSNLTKLSL